MPAYEGAFKNPDGELLLPETTAKQVVCGSTTLDVVLSNLDTDIVEQYSASRNAIISANSDYIVPFYKLGMNNIQVWLDGLYCNMGTDSTRDQFYEVGIAGTDSNVIRFHDDIDMDTSILVRVG